MSSQGLGIQYPVHRAGALAPGRGTDPFEPTQVTGSAKVTFEPGTVLSGVEISPTVAGTPIATVPRPELTITTSGVIYLEATVDAAGALTAVELKNAAALPADTSTLKRRTTANVTLAAGVIAVTARPVRTSLNFYMCNGVPIWERA